MGNIQLQAAPVLPGRFFFALFRVGFLSDLVISVAGAVGDMGSDHRVG